MSKSINQLDFYEDMDSEGSSEEVDSPRSLVIDTEGADSSSLPSTPYSTNYKQILGKFEVNPVPLVGGHPYSLTQATPTATPTTQQANTHPCPQSSTPFIQDSTGHMNSIRSLIVSFDHMVPVCSKEGSTKVDTLVVYSYHWRDVLLDILLTNEYPAYIPIKNVYQKAIPGLKQNVLSARISKHGIRSVVLPEPYVSTLKRLDLGLTGSSHYVTIPDFFKICGYFKYMPPGDLSRFRFLTAAHSPGDVCEMFNNPYSEAGQHLLEQVSSEAVSGVGPGGHSGKSSPAVTPLDERESTVDDTLLEVDARYFFLPGGQSLLLLIRAGVPLIPNPELAKILPNVTRTAMEVIRNTCGIIVQQSTKSEINLMKHLGIVSLKAGRTLLYKITDVAKMYQHWKVVIPDYISELCAGKIPTTKIDLTMLTTQTDSSPGHHYTPSPLTASQLTRPKRKNWRKSKESDLIHGNIDPHKGGGYGSHMTLFGGSGLAHQGNTGTSAQHPLWMKSSATPPPPGPSSLPNSLNVATSSYLTPEWFQQPVQLLNSIQQALSTSSDHPDSSHVIGGSSSMANPSATSISHMTDDKFMSPSGTKLQGFSGRRRASSTSGSPLDDTELEYSTIMWGDECLSLLLPSQNEPHLLVPELVHKVFHDRSYMSPQRRSQVGVVTLPATSLQIHALRARRSLGNFTGNVKLISLSDAVKLAVNGNLRIPGSVIKMLQDSANFLPEPIGKILLPPVSHPHASQQPHPQPSLQPHPQQMPNGVQEASADSEYLAVPTHPDVINLGQGFRIGNGAICQMRWAEHQLVVYIKSRGEYYMGLYQVYEDLFKEYVTRVNFKMRMRRLQVRSIRAAPMVRVKLIEIGALPPHCPVCGLILVSQVECLAKSYGIVPPDVLYEAFLSSAIVSSAPISESKLKKVAVHRKEKPKPTMVSASSAGPLITLQDHNVFMYQYSPNPIGAHPDVSVPNSPPASGTITDLYSNPIGRSDRDKHISPVYGVVPYLTSSCDSLGEPPTSKLLPNLLMTSSPPISTDQIFSSVKNQSEPAGSLMISIPRTLTPFNHTHRTLSSGFNPLPTNLTSSMEAPPISFGGSRRKVLQNLAKKIAQKSRRFNVNLSRVQSPQATAFNPFTTVPGAVNENQGQRSIQATAFNPFATVPGAVNDNQVQRSIEELSSNRMCSSCHLMNPLNKKRCAYCGSFLMGRTCPTCGSLNHNRSKSCTQCQTPMPYSWKDNPGRRASADLSLGQISNSFVTNTISTTAGGGLPTGVGVAYVSPTSSSPTSPKFSAPPIRSVVLKNLFPQEVRQINGTEANTTLGSNGQLLTKTVFLGNLSSSRKCAECGQLNSRMAKKCVQCRSHLQGRPCNRCGRPNLSIVSNCHKCGAHLPSTTAETKWLYKGGRSGRAYKTVQDPQEKILESRAPVSCIRCNKLRMSSYFKCGRCGDLFRTVPVVDQPPELRDEDDRIEPSNHKKRKLSHGLAFNDGKDTLDSSVLNQFARNILSLDVFEQLTPLITIREEESRKEVPAAEEELELAENDYQAFVQKKDVQETLYKNLEAELNGLIREAEKQSSILKIAESAEKEAQEIADMFPEKIKCLEGKIAKIGNFLFSSRREL